MLNFDTLMNKNANSPVIFCGIINKQYDYKFYINLRNILKEKYNITPYFVIFENLPDKEDEQYYYVILDKIKEMDKSTFYKWIDNDELELFYFGEEEVFKYFFEILINYTEKRVNFHFINTRKNKKQNQISFVIKLNLSDKYKEE